MTKATIKKAAALFVAAGFVFSLMSCKKNDETQIENSPSEIIEEVEKPKGNLRIAMTEADGVNTYISNTNITHQASGLVFTNMVEISPAMEALPKGLREVRKNGLTVTLVPNSSCVFADGAVVTSADIAACISAAKLSEAYSAQLANIDKIEDNGGEVILTLFAPDSLFEYLLTLPVIKASEISQRFPTSSGRYSASAEGFTLNSGFSELPEKIDTVALTGFDEIVSALGVGEISLYYTEAENSSASSTTSLQNFYKLNNLVFLGLNAQRGEETLLSSAEGRRAVSEMIDRQIMSDKCYYQRAYPALGAINSFYPCIATKQLISANSSFSSAQERILSLGYEKNTIDGYFEKQGRRCEVSLLVYSASTYKRYAANFIKDALSQNGIYVNVEETDNFDLYKQKIVNGEFDMYIGEVKLYNNMDLSVFLNSNDKSAQLYRSEELLAAYAAFRENADAALGFETLFEAQMPYIPLVWRMGSLVTSKSVSGITPTLSNVFYSIS